MTAGTSLPDGAIIVAGGRGRRLGGVDKAELVIDDRPLLLSVLAAVGDRPVVLVGPDRAISEGVRTVREDPPGGGPAAAIATGLRAFAAQASDATTVAVLAVDLPGLTDATLQRLTAALAQQPSAPGAVLIDREDKEQWLIGVWRVASLQAACATREQWHGGSVRSLLNLAGLLLVPGSPRETTDIDTATDLADWPG